MIEEESSKSLIREGEILSEGKSFLNRTNLLLMK